MHPIVGSNPRMKEPRPPCSCDQVREALVASTRLLERINEGGGWYGEEIDGVIAQCNNALDGYELEAA